MRGAEAVRAKSRVPARKSGVIGIAALWLTVLAIAFFSFRAQDIGRFPEIMSTAIARFAGFDAKSLRDTLLGSIAGLLSVVGWLGYGDVIARVIHADAVVEPLSWAMAKRCAWGAGFISTLMFFLGLAHWYSRPIAAAVALLGVALFVRAVGTLRTQRANVRGAPPVTRFALALVLLPLALAGMAALAPPIAKDTLLYHISLPKAFLDGRGLVDVPFNIAQFYALGAELNGTWAMLLGRIANVRAGEAAFGFSQFAYLPVLLAAIYGWARRRGVGVAESLIPVAVVACVPTVYYSASSGYNDVALALYVTLAIAAFGQWWSKPSGGTAIESGLAIGFALTIKLLALFVIAPVIIVVLLRLRKAEGEGHKQQSIRDVLRTAGLAAVIALVCASPWYVRNWARTGSPVFPFYMNIFRGHADGWDQQRSLTDQFLNSRYGGYPKSVVDYAVVPVRMSITAQPEIPRDFDGVLSISFLFGIPMVVFAFARKRMDVESKIAFGLAIAYFVAWLFSSEQLRYLLPALPALAIAMVAAMNEVDRRLKWVLLASALPGVVVVMAWFFTQNPVPVLVGAESRNSYLERNLDHYSMYETVNSQLPADARVWLINMRRDTYYIERPYFSDFRIEHHTLMQLVREANDVEELRRRAHELGVTHVLARFDNLLDPATTPFVDERRSREENDRKVAMVREFLLSGKVIRLRDKFVLFGL